MKTLINWNVVNEVYALKLLTSSRRYNGELLWSAQAKTNDSPSSDSCPPERPPTALPPTAIESKQEMSGDGRVS